jgi:quercetin dioxygenase-like cupin family protein
MVRSTPPARSAGIALLAMIALMALAAPTEAQDSPISLTADDPSLEWFPCGDFIPEDCQATILRLGPDGSNSDVLYRIPANMPLPAHWHTSQERMILISGEFHIDYEGHLPLVMRAGSYAWGPPQVPHTARCGNQGTCLLFVAFVEPPDGFPAEERADGG